MIPLIENYFKHSFLHSRILKYYTVFSLLSSLNLLIEILDLIWPCFPKLSRPNQISIAYYRFSSFTECSISFIRRQILVDILKCMLLRKSRDLNPPKVQKKPGQLLYLGKQFKHEFTRHWKDTKFPRKSLWSWWTHWLKIKRTISFIIDYILFLSRV